ncbi:MAG: DUF348 domain-containing protein [Armatimonadetes bacterium]|nr:DUF348 domain-containing protein [Armatimonadota bacterium]
MRPLMSRRVLATFVTAASLAVGAVSLAQRPLIVAIAAEAGVRKVWTHQPTVGSALAEAGIAVRPYDRVNPGIAEPLASEMTIRIRRAFPVTLIVDGRTLQVMTASESVEEFLAERHGGVRLRPRDRVHPPMDTRLWSGAVVRVVRINTLLVTREERLPFARLIRPDATLPRGMTRLVQAGRPGTRMLRIAVTTADGRVVDRQVIGNVLARPPQDQISQVGTRRIIATRGEFAGKEIVHMEATGYAPWHGKGVDGTTAIGMRAGFGVVAVDPRVIPLRSELFIEGYGRAIAGDTGGAIKGHRIDLGFNTARQAYQFGRRPVRVYILSVPPPRRK